MSIKNVFQRKNTLIKRHNKIRMDFKLFMKKYGQSNDAIPRARRLKQIEKGMLRAENGLV
jgi:hypothetical protein